MKRYPEDPGYVAGSDTSEAAAKDIAESAPSLCERIWRFIHSRGALGSTCDAVEFVFDMRHQTASARIRELVLAGRLRDTGERQLTRSGSKARVYVTIS